MDRQLMLFFAFYLLAPLLPLYLRDTFSAGKAMIGIVLSGYTLTALCVRHSAASWLTPSPARRYF